MTRSQDTSIGLIGFGQWGQAIARSISKYRNCKISAIVSSYRIDSENLDKNSIVYGNSIDMYKSNSISAVIIANSPEKHCKEAFLALTQKLPTWIEKPLTLDPRESLMLLNFGKKQNSRVFVDHIFVHSIGWLIFKEASLDLGQLTRIESAGGAPLPIRKLISPLWDWGPHDLSLVLDLVGQIPSSIIARTDRDSDTFTKFTFNTLVDLKFPSGITSSSTFGNNFNEKKRWLKAYFENGELEICNFDDGPILKKLYRSLPGSSALKIPVPVEPRPLDAAIIQFLDLVAGTNINLKDLELGHQIVSVLSEIEHQIFR